MDDLKFVETQTAVSGGEEFMQSVLSGLGKPQKTLECKFLYDERGSELFDAICDLPEYYPTRTEIGIFEEILPEIAAFLGESAEVIELGSGAGRKTRMLLDALNVPSLYVPVDISEEFVLEVAEGLQARYPNLKVKPSIADFMADFDVPEKMSKRMLFFPGSTIGNLTPSEAEEFLGELKENTQADYFLIGVDLKKSRAVLEAAYDDAQGVTAEFNLNLLHRANRELKADFDVGAFRHHAVYNQAEGRIEMHLVSLKDQIAQIREYRFTFAEGETIHTENSYKYTVDEFSELVERAGWQLENCWTDKEGKFAVMMLKA
ncbi:L-histidine N(alpha)-methyltransferase [Kordiimonas sp. SCSIO 12603]|uniref:L-histidine N(alpha)-methyltransferase n=1 Tax=Kordiimonas sp. SCSIO 12603 TaxID=2829596 RepID=UPI002103D0FE|nr:L-histidine N(alpha)-methyltransferase [Kordiimonas sp. SCSIO 12603]UTW57810.1 L-histidine N(alpha)-methyltransferase [Kordiimonas sp. SCSIO 12603]